MGRFGLDQYGNYVGPRKIVFRPRRRPSLACRCLRDGSLDVDLRDGKVYSRWQGRKRLRRLRIERDDYLSFSLNREKSHRRGRSERDRRRTRWRYRMCVMVHRLVMMKKLAVDLGGSKWREYVKDIPPNIDVHHRDGCQWNNGVKNLRLSTDTANRGKREMTPDEAAAVAAFAEAMPF